MGVIYISGPITGVARYWDAFWKAENTLRTKGWIVLNPVQLPAGMPQEKYMPICLSMLQAADAVCLLDGWEASGGAKIEALFARYQGKTVYGSPELVPPVKAGET